MARKLMRLAPAFALAFVLVAMVACDDDPLAPFEPEITNATDSFQLQATGVTGRTATLTYTWQNTGTQATVDHSTVTTGGSATVQLLDAAGTTVYDATLSPSLNEATTAGAAGAWTVRLRLQGFSGTLNFRVQKL